MKIEELTTELEAAYSAWLLEQPTAMLYHSLPYLKLIAELTQGQPQVFLATKAEKICGAWSAVSRDGPFGKVINSLPYYGSHGGPIYDHEAAANLLVERWNALINSEGVGSATLVENILDRSGLGSAVTHEIEDYRIGQITDIAFTENHAAGLMERFHSKTRNVVRKSEKQGFTVAVENDALDFLYETHRDNLKAIGGQAKSEAFFRAIPERFVANKDYTIWVARHQGQPVAALLLFYFRQTVEYFAPVIVESWREAQPLSLLIYRSMIAASEAGYRRWNWGGTWATQDGVYHFKKRWGAEDHHYKYFTHLANPNIRQAKPADLLTHYPGFFVIPFSQLVPSS